MRLILTLILALPLFAQLDIPLMSKRPGLSRSGLAMGVTAGQTNLLRYSEDFSNAAWIPTNATFANNTLTASGAGLLNRNIYQIITSSAGAYTLTFRISAGTAPSATVALYDQSATSFVAQAEYTFTTNALTVVVGSAVATTVSPGVIDISVTGTFPTGATNDIALLYMRSPAQSADTDTVLTYRASLNLGSTALPYVATTDLQSVASIGPGTGSIVRGANTGASTDDPTVSLLGWTLDSGDRVSGLPAKGAAWTTINCSDVECFGIDSAGGQWVNGVARRNLLRWSEDFSNAAWDGFGAFGNWGKSTATASVITATSAASGRIQRIIATTNTAYTCSADLKAGTETAVNLYLIWGLNEGYVGASVPVTVTLTGDFARGEVTATTPASGVNQIECAIRSTTDGATFYARNAQLNLGSTALEYQKTTDSREWLLGTPGNYVGLLTGWYRWDRALNPGEVYRNYMQFLKPRINSVGNTLP